MKFPARSTALSIALFASISAYANPEPVEIQASFFKLNGKSDFRTEWDPATFSGRVHMRVLWQNQTEASQAISFGIGQSRVQRLVSPALPENCQIHSTFGSISRANPAFAHTVEFGLWGTGCEPVIASLRNERIVLEFEDVPSMGSGLPGAAFVRLALQELPGATLAKEELMERYKDLYSYNDEDQGCITHWAPLDEMNDMAAAALARFSVSLAKAQVLSIDNYTGAFTDWKFPEMQRCPNQITFKSTVVYRPNDWPPECTLSVQVTKVTDYLPGRKHFSSYQFSEWPDYDCKTN